MEDDTAVPQEDSENRRVSKSVLDNFRAISSAKDAVRLKCSLNLLKHIHIQATNDQESTELKYALKRLIRGLGASNATAKIGYYTTLVGLLKTCPSIEVQDVLQCVKEQLKTGDSKSEMGDVFTGQILACGALLHSDLLTHATLNEQSSVIHQMLAASKKRSYLTLAASTFISDLVSQIDDKRFNKVLWPLLQLELAKSWPEQTIDSLYLLTLVLNRFPSLLKDSTLKKCFGNGGVYSEENAKPICDLLMSNTSLASLKHPGYITISKEISNSSMLLPFMTNLDGILVKPNRNRILATALIIKSMLASPIARTQLPHLVPNNFLIQLLAYYKMYSHDKDLQEGMTKFFDALSECLKGEIDDKLKVAVIKKFLFDPGTLMFEKIAKTKIIQHFVNSLNPSGVKKLSKIYHEVVAKGRNNEKQWWNSERAYAAQLLVKLLHLPCMQNETTWKMKQLTFLMNVSIINHAKFPGIGSELSGALTDIFYRALDLKFAKLEDMRVLLSELMNQIESLVTLENYTETVKTSLTSDDFEILQKTLKITKKLAGKTKKYVVVFHVLFLHMGLQLFKEKELAISSLNELFSCYERVRHERKVGKHDASDSEPQWIEVVIDLFLNLLSHKSHLLRNIITSVFPHLCEFMTASSLHQLLSVLNHESDSNPLSKSDSDGDDEDTQQESGHESNESEHESDESDAEFEDPVERETVTDKLRMAVSKALGNDGYKTDDESIDLDNISDNEGEQLNSALAAAFKQYKPNRGKSKKQTKDEETLTHFRIRVLDLLESFIASEPSMLSCFEIMLQLLQTLEFTIKDPHQAPLQDRLKYCLKKLTNSRKFNSVDEVTPDVVNDLLNSLLAKGSKSALIYQDMSNELSQCFLFVMKCAQVLEGCEATPKKTKKHLKAATLQIIENALGMYFNNRDCLIPYYLFKLIFQSNWSGNFVLASILFNSAFDKTVRPFRRSQALELLKIFYTNNRLRKDVEAFKEHVEEHEVRFCARVAELLDEFCANPNTTVIKERFIFYIFTLLRVMSIQGYKSATVDWESLGEKVREYRSHVQLSKDAKGAYNLLCGRLGISNLVKMKNQVVKFTPDEDDPALVAKGKKVNQKQAVSSSKAKKSKKEARDLRVKSMSEGLSDAVSFSSNVFSGGPTVNGTAVTVNKRKRIDLDSGVRNKRVK